MLQSLIQMRGDTIGASDGEIGHIQDFYFDDKQWVVRYVVVDTGVWIFGRSVLISPQAFKSTFEPGNPMLVILTRQQIEKSPPMESHKPVTRKYEEAYLGYYGWPYYWLGLGVWGMNNTTTPTPPPTESVGGTVAKGNQRSEDIDAHLQSIVDLGRYEVHVGGGENDESVGTVVDFLVEDRDWTIRHLVIKTGTWADEKTLLLAPSQVDRIDMTNKDLHVKVTRAHLMQATVYQPL